LSTTLGAAETVTRYLEEEGTNLQNYEIRDARESNDIHSWQERKMSLQLSNRQ